MDGSGGQREQRPVLVDSHEQAVPAWPNDVLEINMKVLAWYRGCYEEQRATMGAIIDAYDQLAQRLAAHPSLPPAAQELIARMMARAEDPE